MNVKNDPEDLVLEIRPTPDDGYRTKILSSAFGFPEAPFEPLTQADRLDAELYWLDRQIVEILAKPEQAAKRRAELDAEQRRRGSALFAALLQDQVAVVFTRSLTEAELPRDGRPGSLPLRLVFDPDLRPLNRIAAEPWELLFQADTRDFLARTRATPLARFLDLPRRITDDFEVRGRLRILVVQSAPENLHPLKLAEEQQQIRKALEEHPEIELDFHPKPVLRDLRRRLLDEPFHVLHFMGHGGFDGETGEGALAFVGDDGRDARVPGMLLGEYLKDIPELRLVVLSACYGAALPRRQGQDLLTAVAPALMMAGIPAVIAMQFPISDEAATAFSRSFYAALAAGDPVDTAAAEGRLASLGAPSASHEWATPALFLRVRNGRILHLAGRDAAPRENDLPEDRTPMGHRDSVLTPRSRRAAVRLGIRSFANGWGDRMEKENDFVLDLTEHFDGRFIHDPALWQEALFPTLEAFLLKHAEERQPLVIDFAAHWSLAFAAGYCLEAKSGLDITLRQRRQDGTADWWSQDGTPPEGKLWSFEGGGERFEGREPRDVAVAIGITLSVTEDVGVYLEESGLEVGRVLPADLLPAPSSTGVRNGAHALRLAQQLAGEIRARSVAERRGLLHLFCAGPNAFVFLLGQLSRSFGRVELYEHDFEAGVPGAYRPALALPVPKP